MDDLNKIYQGNTLETLKMNDNLGRLLESSSKILLKAKEWKATGGFKHKNPCQDWKRNKHCIHYAKARYRQFKSEIDPVLKDMGI